ncbi:MAG: transposase [Lachnospiraceae bacterium]|jgi:putative transposase|nr:transposase [Lachnospiraceae bacterium]MCI1727074.1 transposase [Lachnospiraceae bacterium]
MPRVSRLPSTTGIFHVMQRGANRQDLFFDDEDRHQYLRLLQYALEEGTFTLHAFCLMSDHVHLLISESEGSCISSFMHGIDTRYARYYNTKYERIGPVFNDRFLSKPVEDTAYYLCVLRYIAYNPVKAGLCREAFRYPWGSLYAFGTPKELTDSARVCSISQMNQTDLIRCLNHTNGQDGLVLENEERQPLISDARALNVYRTVSETENPADFALFSKEKKGCILRKMTEARCSLRQIARLLGISRKQIAKFLE